MQVSSFPRTAKFTPASLSNCTVARATFCARGSNDAAQPIQNRYSKAGFDSTVGASRRSAQASADIRVANTGSSSKKALDICEKPEGPVFYSATLRNKRMQTRADDYVSKEMSIHALTKRSAAGTERKSMLDWRPGTLHHLKCQNIAR